MGARATSFGGGPDGTGTMKHGDDDTIIDRAIGWQQAIALGEVDWDGLTRWLEADPRHRLVFDEIALIDDAVDRHREAIAAILPRDEALTDRRNGRRWLIGGSVAAALALAIGVPMLQNPATSPTIYASAPGKTRSVTLDDGSRIALSAASTISVGPRQRHIALTGGAAYFDVPHDSARHLVIMASGYRIADIGTRFAVDAGSGRVSVAVAEGSVTVTPPHGAAVTLHAGQRLSGTADAPPEVSSVSPAAVGSWRGGRLIYNNAPLAMVADDISRYRGSPVVIDPALADRRFSGVLVIGDGSGLVADLAGVAGLKVVRRGDIVVLHGGAA